MTQKNWKDTILYAKPFVKFDLAERMLGGNDHKMKDSYEFVDIVE